MKGVVFTVFLELVEKEFGDEVVDRLVSNESLKSEGVYTSVGTYDYQELMTMVKQLSDISEVPISGLVKVFGKYLFGTFLTSYPHFFERCDHAFDFFESINDYIHVEVKKLYPDAELPHFETNRAGNHQMTLIYKSKRRLSALAHGLLEASLEHYGEKFTITSEELEGSSEKVLFTIDIE